MEMIIKLCMNWKHKIVLWCLCERHLQTLVTPPPPPELGTKWVWKMNG